GVIVERKLLQTAERGDLWRHRAQPVPAQVKLLQVLKTRERVRQGLASTRPLLLQVARVERAIEPQHAQARQSADRARERDVHRAPAPDPRAGGPARAGALSRAPPAPTGGTAAGSA